MAHTPDPNAADVWVRNPSYCIRECVEEAMFDHIWDKGWIIKYNVDPMKFASTWCGGMPWRYIVVDDSKDVCIETRSDGTKRPHDLWLYGQSMERLEEMLAENAGSDRMVIVTSIPKLNTATGKKFARMLHDVAADNLDSILHIHAQYSYPFMFGGNFRSVDIEPRIPARQGTIYLPNGRKMPYVEAARMREWVNVLGMSLQQLKLPRNRCLYNMRSARWASRFYKQKPYFATLFEPTAPFTANVGDKKKVFFRYVKPVDGDKLTCDTCSLAETCRFYREGAICAVPDSDVANLDEYFNTRDADAIVEGLGELLASQMQRLQMGMDGEVESGKLSRETSALFDKIFKNGVALAKLVDPTLAKPAVAVTVNGGGPALPEAASKQALMAAVVGELEARGVARSDMTPEMVNNLLAEKAEQVALNRSK